MITGRCEEEGDRGWGRLETGRKGHEIRERERERAKIGRPINKEAEIIEFFNSVRPSTPCPGSLAFPNKSWS